MKQWSKRWLLLIGLMSLLAMSLVSVQAGDLSLPDDVTPFKCGTVFTGSDRDLGRNNSFEVKPGTLIQVSFNQSRPSDMRIGIDFDVDFFRKEFFSATSGSYAVPVTEADVASVRVSSRDSNSRVEVRVSMICPSESATPFPRDARINWGLCEGQVVLYRVEGGLQVYRVVNGNQGVLLSSITAADLGDYATQAPSENTLIWEKEGVRLYVLETGELQLNAPAGNGYKECALIIDSLAGKLLTASEVTE